MLTGLFPSGANGIDFIVSSVNSATEFEANVGISTIAHTYVSGGTAAVGITTTVFPDRNKAFIVESILTDGSFTVDVGVSTINHAYVSGGTFQKFEPFLFGKETNDPNFVYLNELEFNCPGGQTAGLTTTLFPVESEAFPVIFLDDPAHIRILVGISSIVHEYVGGGTIGEYTKNNPGSGYNTRVSVAVTDPNHTGAPAEIVGIPTDGGELLINIIDPGSGYVDPQLSVPDPQYFNLPVTGVFRRRTGFGTETGRNLFINCTVGGANTTAIGRSEYFQVSNYEITNQGYSFEPGDVIEAVGLATDKRLAGIGSGPIEPFQLTVLETFTDNFSAWNFGELDYIDSIKPLQDGIRTRFPLIYKGESFSFESNPGDEDSSVIDLDSILLIYVNTVLQVPGQSYIFDGGSSFEFTRAPFIEDDIDIYFYRGKRNIDSRTVTEVDESIRPGDELQIKKNDAINQKNLSDPKTLTQDIRTVTEIASSDTVRTNIYFGSGDLETVRPRQVAWDKQKRDVFIYGEAFSKARDSLEPIIQPTASIIRSAGKAATELFVDNADLFKYEETISPSVLTNIELNAYIPVPEDFVPAQIDLSVTGGSVSGVNLVNPGQGYVGATQITVASPAGIGTTGRAELDVNFGSGSISAVVIDEDGFGYDDNNPPRVLIEEPVPQKEELGIVQTVQGFTGIITAIEPLNNPAPGITYGIRFSYRVSADTQTPSELVSGYSFVVSNTLVGNGVESVTTLNSNIVGVGTQGVDCVYEARQTTSLGFNGTVTVNVSSSTDVSGIATQGNNLGYLSWGRLSGLLARDIDEALFYDVDGKTFTSDMKNYPTIVRTTEGLRNEGGLTKRA